MGNRWDQIKQFFRSNKAEFKSGFFFGIKIIGFVFLITAIFFVLSAIYSMQLDNYFSVLYANEIQPNGEREINNIVNEVRNISDYREKLNRIGEWETKNFINYWWERTYKNNSQYEFKPMDGLIGRYDYDTNGKIRALNVPLPNKYANNPAWIAYYKTGECGELAYLFANVSNRSGFETRIVVADLSVIPILNIATGNHAWVEVKIGDEWWYFDPDTFGQSYNFGYNPVRGWFNQTKYYDAFSPSQVGRVYLESTNEDVKDRYPLLKGAS